MTNLTSMQFKNMVNSMCLFSLSLIFFYGSDSVGEIISLEERKYKVKSLIVQLSELQEAVNVFQVKDSSQFPVLVEDKTKLFVPSECYIVIIRNNSNNCDQEWNIYYLLGYLARIDTRQNTAKYTILLYSELRDIRKAKIYRRFESFTEGKTINDVRFFTQPLTSRPQAESREMYIVKNVNGKRIITKKVSSPQVAVQLNWLQDDYCVILLVPDPFHVHFICGKNTDENTKVYGHELTKELVKGCMEYVIKYETMSQAKNEFRKVLGNRPAQFYPSYLFSINESLKQNGASFIRIFKNEQDEIKIIQAYHLILHYEYLNSNECFFLGSSSESGYFLWIGKYSSDEILLESAEFVEEFINKDYTYINIMVSIIHEGNMNENIDFMIEFESWYKEFPKNVSV